MEKRPYEKINYQQFSMDVEAADRTIALHQLQE